MRASDVSGDTGSSVTVADTGTRTDAHDCFLCAYTPWACDVPQVEGRLLRVHVPPERQRAAYVLLARDDGAELRLRLPLRTRKLAEALADLPPDTLRRLRLRAFHLSAAPGDASDDSVSGHPARLVAGEASALVIEPDLLLNITDLNNGEYCVRQYPLRQLVPSPPNAATLRGTAIHAAFKELLKGGGAGLDAYFEQAIQARATDLALQQVPAGALRDDALPHLRALDAWHAHQHATLWGHAPDVRAETFLLAPQVGLKGRLDFLLTGAGGGNLLELKTGNAHAALPRREHRWQVYGYLTLLAALRPPTSIAAHGARPRATLLYSGTPGQAEGYGVVFTLRDALRVLDLRNLLALVHATGHVPPPPGGKTCARCALREPCLRTSALLGWHPPESDERPAPIARDEAARFTTLYDLLRREQQAGERETAALWQMPPGRRIAAGIALGELELDGEPVATAAGEWEYHFRCTQDSELREGDEVLLSNGDPLRGEVVSGTILRLSAHGVTVWTPERIAQPRLIDRYASDITAHRTLRNLWRWLDADPRLRALVAGERAPRFGSPPLLDDLDAEFNAEQRAAVARALSAEDFALVQGPPGTGKTRVVAAIARRAMARGERVLLAAFTNQAVDNVLLRLLAEGCEDGVRLGHELSVAPAVRPLRLAPRTSARLGLPADAPLDPAELRTTLLAAPLVAATTATWAAERHDDAGDAVAFDLALVDEASQLTLPALLGALRFARRFVLVGDEQQLPPLVMSREAAARGLGRSPLAALLERWGDVAGVRLERQYRMHPAICGFPSAAFYDGRLAAEGTARSALLDIALAADDPYAAALAPERPLVFVDVLGADEPAGKVSRAQAEVVRALVLALRASGVGAAEIAVIAPYRAQVGQIRQRLAARGEAAVAVDTVDRFQGAERPVVIFAFGGRTSPPDPLSPLARGNRSGGDFVAEPRRLNVALTRAQRKLILVGDRAWLERQSPLLAQLVAYCRELYGGRGGIVRAGGSGSLV